MNRLPEVSKSSTFGLSVGNNT
jgi:hypothetical protein